MSQLSFSFQNNSKKNLFDEEDFVLLVENSAAVKFLKQFFAQTDFASSQFSSLIIQGPKHCGKTHLLHIFAEKFSAEFLNEEQISNLNLASFFAKNKFYIFENIDEIQNEETLFHLINSAFEASAFLIFTNEGERKFQLKDLNSRLKNIVVAEIKNPSAESIKQLLVNGFSRKQIKLPAQIVNFISENIDRTYEAVLSAIKRVELLCAEGGKNIAMKDVKEVFTSSKNIPKQL